MSSTLRKTISSGKLITEVPHFVNADGEHLFCKYWETKDPPTSLVCILHGFGEHCARYNEFASHLNDIGAYVFSHDHVGHGESEGEGWYLSDYEVLVRDALQHVDLVKSKYPDLPIFLFGHSLGGTTAILAAHRRPELFRGVVISAPAIVENKNIATPFRLFLLRMLVSWFPRLSLGSADPNWLTRDPEQVQISENDPLVSHGGMMARTAETGLKMTKNVREILENVEFPFLVTHGSGDKITSLEGSEMLYEKAKSADKTLKIYPELHHNLAHELLEDRIIHFNTVADWIKSRIP